MNKCKKIETMIPLSFYNDLSIKEAEKLQRHIKDCKECREEYEATMSVLGKIPNEHKFSLSKNEYQKLEKRIRTKIVNESKDHLALKKQALSLSYVSLMLILLISVIIALKNPAVDNQNESYNIERTSKMFIYPDTKTETKNGFFYSGDRTNIDLYSENTAGSDMNSIIYDFESIAYNDKDSEVRKSAVIALAQIRTRSAIRSLMEISRSHPDSSIRIEAIRCLAHISKDSYERRYFLEL